MRFMVDECVGNKVATWLHTNGHEIYSIYAEARGIQDNDIIYRAFNENWILITADKDFGEKIFRERYPHHGVILMRLEDERSCIKIAVLQKLLDNYAHRLLDNFVVVTEMTVRFARLTLLN